MSASGASRAPGRIHSCFKWPALSITLLVSLLIVSLPGSVLAQTAPAEVGVFDSLINSFLLALKSGRGPLVLALAFVAGFISSLTPCVYPMIPITLSLFGANADVPRSKAFLLSLTYVLGIATTYTSLGLLSAQAGFVFGSFLGNPIVIAVLCVLLLLLTLYTLDIIQFGFIANIQNSASRVGGRGYLGGFLMGAASGLVAAPCVGPVLVVIIGYVAASGNTLWGGLVLFCYSLGLGLIFLILGTFSGMISKLPKSGNWLHGVKFLMAVTLLMVSLFLAQAFVTVPLNARDHLVVLLVIASIALVVAAVAFRKDLKAPKFVSAALLAIALYKIVVPDSEVLASKQASEGVVWMDNLDAALARARSENKPVLLDLYADWCAACKELDSITFTDSAVIDSLKKFVTARVDFTTENETTLKITEEFGIIGLPSVLLLDSSGKEIPDTRIVQFLEPEPFKEHLEKTLAAPPAAQ